jgi:hypothetical protein
MSLRAVMSWSDGFGCHDRGIADYIVDFDNAHRLHSICGYRSPNEYKRSLV